MAKKTKPEPQSYLDMTEDEGETPFFLYFLALLFSFFGFAQVASVLFLLPDNIRPYGEWLLRFSLGMFLCFFILLLLTFVRVKASRAGRVVTWLTGLAWLIWAVVMSAFRGMSWLPLLVALLLAFLFFFSGLFYASGFLLPIERPGRERYKVFAFLLDYLMTVFVSKVTFGHFGFFISNYPCWVLTDEPREEDKLEERIPGTPFSQYNFGSGFIICDCDHAIAISDGIKFKGVQGPGVIFTGFGDRPLRTLDLRPQLRTKTVSGLTQDGIQVKVLFFIPFQVHRGGQEPQLGEPLPYRARDARKAVLAQKIDRRVVEKDRLSVQVPETARDKKARQQAGGGKDRTPGYKAEKISTYELEQVPWDELPVIIGTRVMQDVLSRYRFDDLYDPYGRLAEPPRRRIAREFLEALDRELLPLGIQRVPGAGGISDLKPASEEVLEQRIRTWRANWVRQMLLKQAKSQTERLRRIEHARAQAQADLILRLGARLADMDKAGVAITPEKIVPEFLNILEEIALQPSLRRYLPRETSQELRRWREGRG